MGRIFDFGGLRFYFVGKLFEDRCGAWVSLRGQNLIGSHPDKTVIGMVRGNSFLIRLHDSFLRFMQGALGEPIVTVQPNYEIHVASPFYPAIAKELNVPLITGKTKQREREELYAAFKSEQIKTLVVSKVANFAVDQLR